MIYMIDMIYLLNQFDFLNLIDKSCRYLQQSSENCRNFVLFQRVSRGRKKNRHFCAVFVRHTLIVVLYKLSIFFFSPLPLPPRIQENSIHVCFFLTLHTLWNYSNFVLTLFSILYLIAYTLTFNVNHPFDFQMATLFFDKDLKNRKKKKTSFFPKTLMRIILIPDKPACPKGKYISCPFFIRQ